MQKSSGSEATAATPCCSKLTAHSGNCKQEAEEGSVPVAVHLTLGRKRNADEAKLEELGQRMREESGHPFLFLSFRSIGAAQTAKDVRFQCVAVCDAFTRGNDGTIRD